MSKRKNEGEGRTGREVSHDEIARRAFEISLGADAGTAEENWQRAEQELQGEPSQEAQA